MSSKDHLKLDVEVLSALLDGTRAEARAAGRAFAGGEGLLLEDSWTLEEKREATRESLQKLVETGIARTPLPERLGGENQHDQHITMFEEIVTVSPSLQIKAGVQIGLFAGAIQHLGNEEQHDAWLLDAIEGRLLGSFAMTEIGHGSDVAAVATTAEYDPETQEFVINTPFRAAYKEYIGNAACHAQAAVVFARLITAGVDHGVHALFVPVRDESGNPLPGISIEDDGYKGGLPGVDNGRFAFDHVRVPRTHLLDRYGSVSEDGEYSSPIESPGRRFFTMLGTLVQGRVSLVGASNTAAKLAADIAVRYALARRQFQSPDAAEESTLLSYRRHQRRLLPKLAQIWANQAAYERLLDQFDAVFSGRDDTEEARAELETLAAGLKATTTWEALDIIQEAREACGGAGFMAENRLVGLRHDLDVYATFEGDNTVLLQLVGKRLLTDYASEMRDLDVGGIARYVGSYAAERTLFRSGIANVSSTIGDLFTPAMNEKRIRSGRLQEALLASRAEVTLTELAANLRPAKKMGSTEAAELFNDHQNDLIETARAFIELHKWRALNDLMHSVDPKDNPAEAKFLRRIRDLYGLELISAHAGWHIANGRLSMTRARQIEPTINRLVRKLAANAGDAVAAFGYGPEHRRCPIADGAEEQRQLEARDYYAELKRSGNMPRDEKDIYRRKQQREAQLKAKSTDS